MNRILTVLLLLILAISLLTACGLPSAGDENTPPGDDGKSPVDDGNETHSSDDDEPPASDDGKSAPDDNNGSDDNNINEKSLEELMENTIQTTITMEDGSIIVAELYPDLAPQTVCNFVSLARSGYYDGLKFHRIISGFMIQGGCPNGTGTGNPGYYIKGEFEQNGFKNDLKHTPGVISMARSQHPDSAGSQFFIMHAEHSSLDGAYAAFGKVISGFEVVDELSKTPVIDNNGSVAPENMPVIASITIDSDIILPEPDRLN